MSVSMIAASGGDAFFSGLVLGIVTGMVTAPILRSWLVWRGRNEVSRHVGEAHSPRPSEARTPRNGHVTSQPSDRQPVA